MTSAPYNKEFYNPVQAFAFEQITVTGSAVGFTTATIDPGTVGRALMATVTVETNPVRYRTDGTNPTATVGTLLNVGDKLVIWGSVDVRRVRFIATGGNSLLDCEYSN